MRSFFRSTSLIATLIGTLVAGIGGAAAYERGDGFVLSKSGRLASPGDFFRKLLDRPNAPARLFGALPPSDRNRDVEHAAARQM